MNTITCFRIYFETFFNVTEDVCIEMLNKLINDTDLEKELSDFLGRALEAVRMYSIEEKEEIKLVMLEIFDEGAKKPEKITKLTCLEENFAYTRLNLPKGGPENRKLTLMFFAVYKIGILAASRHQNLMNLRSYGMSYDSVVK